MVLVNSKNGMSLGTIPSNRQRTLIECINYLGGRVISDQMDPLWQMEGDNVIIYGYRYRLEDLYVSPQIVSDDDICTMLAEALKLSDDEDEDGFVTQAYLTRRFLDISDPLQTFDQEVIEQLHVLWHVANDPFETLLEKMKLKDGQCAKRFAIDSETIQKCISGELRLAPYDRLMMAEATGLLKLRTIA